MDSLTVDIIFGIGAFALGIAFYYLIQKIRDRFQRERDAKGEREDLRKRDGALRKERLQEAEA